MDCETCKEKRRVIAQTPKDVPYIAHESAVARLERVIKRLWVLVLALIILLCASNAAWIWWESQQTTTATRNFSSLQTAWNTTRYGKSYRN